MEMEAGFLDEFKALEDPRIERKKLHPMEEILFATICGVLCGSESWEALEIFGQVKIDFLREYFPYEHGCASDDTFRRFFRALAPDSFQECFVAWMKRFQIELSKGVIALDGKTSRRTFDGDGNPLHLVSAFASEARMVLAQQKVPTKSNEITALKEILNWLDLRGSVVTIDAMGCQTEIANQIVENGGDYVLALKGNQGTLQEDVKTFFEVELKQSTPKLETFSCTEKGHGRIESRTCHVSMDVEWLTERHPHWSTITGIACIQSERILKDKTTHETRWYITSKASSAETILHNVRSHWSVENSLHWVLDMTFGDDQSRIRKDNSPLNMAIIKHIALNICRQNKAKRQSVKQLRMVAGWNDQTLHTLVKAGF